VGTNVIFCVKEIKMPAENHQPVICLKPLTNVITSPGGIKSITVNCLGEIDLIIILNLAANARLRILK
jgi:hypothetical protein